MFQVLGNHYMHGLCTGLCLLKRPEYLPLQDLDRKSSCHMNHHGIPISVQRASNRQLMLQQHRTQKRETQVN